ncbi:MAG TPA: VWA domain-containing protein [Myxococcota bacterium]|nr:VWA domain-containing protein [Myxococcota bacterium]
MSWATPTELWTEPLEVLDPVFLWLLVLPPLLVFVLPKTNALADRARNLGSLLVRILALWALVLAAARPVTLRDVPDLSLVVAVDASGSMSEARLADVRGLVEGYLANTDVPVEWVEASGDDETDLAALVDLAVAAAPPAESRRVLLLSDGADTRGQAGVERVVAGAALAGARGVQIHPVPPGVADDNRGVHGLDLPLAVEAFSRTEALVRVHSTGSGPATVVLRLGDEVLAEEDVELVPGTQELRMSFRAPRAGTHKVEALVDGGDPWPGDDARSGWMVTTTDGPVLVHGNRHEVLVAALLARGVEARSVSEIPNATPEGAALVLLAPDMEAWDPELPERLQALVRDDGVDLVLAGGPQGLGSDEEWMEPLDRTLPVVFPQKKKRQPPPLAVAYVIDRSDSMAREGKLDLAVAAVTQSVEMLSPDSRVGVLTFSDSSEWIVPLTRAKNKTAIIEAVGSIRVSGGTEIYPALEVAFEALAATDALVRHIIVLTDGRGNTRIDQHSDLMRRISASSVSVSTVALSAEAAREELQRVADRGRGRAWYTETLEDLPKIFVEETMTLLRKNAVEEDDSVRAMPGSPLAGSRDWSAAPLLGGYNEARAKPTASLGLVLGDRSRPLLSSWRYGLGSATVFSSELGGGWGSRWVEWEGFSPWLAELVEAIRLRPETRELFISVEATQEGVVVVLDVLDVLGVPREGLVPELRIRGDGTEREVDFDEVVPGRYAATVEWDGPLLLTAVVPSGPGTPAGVVRAQVAPPPSPELSGTLLDIDRLEAIAAASGGRVLPDPRVLLDEGVRDRRDRRHHWLWLLWTGIGSLLVDVAIRRIRGGSAVG